MMADMGIAEFLAARWDEREAAAKATGDDKARTWSAESDIHPDAWRVIDGHGEVVVYDEGAPTEAEAAHIALNDPAAVLADIDAKRKILAEHARAPWFTEDTLARWRTGGHVPEERIAAAGASASCARCHKVIPDAAVDEDQCADFDYPCPTVRLLAAPFASHPEYQEAWKP